MLLTDLPPAGHHRVGATRGVVDTQTLSLALIPTSVQQHLLGHGSATSCFPISRPFGKMQSQKQGG